ncbi:MAG: hypothetical protein JW863_04015 [Chitinispirillaceae bacterium]|nr:hypothetical protein [Chitinispirillaceae bacterium]
MIFSEKTLLLFSSLLALGGILLMIKSTLHRCSNQCAENSDESIHGKLSDAKRTLEKTAVVIQNVLDTMEPEPPVHPDGTND